MLGVMALLLLSACGPAVVYDEEVALPGQWTYADSAVFAYEIADTSLRYDLQLSLKHTDAFPTQNLYARFVTAYPNGLRESQPVSLELADKYGRWLGDCGGERCTLTVPIQRGAQYPEPGRYGLILHQYGRTEALNGVEGVGLSVTVAP